MTPLPWKPGPLPLHTSPCFVAAARFTYASVAALLPVFWHGLRLRRAWPRVDGAVALSVMADIRTRSTYTISVWASHGELRSWVRSADHAHLMQAWRSKLTGTAYAGWEVQALDLQACYRHAMDRVRA